jgi:hypothetical protein
MSTDTQTVQQIPFTLNDRSGRVAVGYGPGQDPVQAGFDALPGINLPLERCLGYPVMHAQIDQYDGSGYRTLCGWIQIVTRECYAKGDTERENLLRSRSVDLAPSMHGMGIPWVTYGTLPSIFDAPCLNLGGNAELTWTADTFLTTLPLHSREEPIDWLLGFRWGYREYDPASGRPIELLSLQITDGQIRNHHLEFLRREFATWRFGQVEKAQQPAKTGV